MSDHTELALAFWFSTIFCLLFSLIFLFFFSFQFYIFTRMLDSDVLLQNLFNCIYFVI